MPFRREVPLGRGTRNRVDALEVDLERLVRGWDQHIPTLLAAVADVRADVFEATELQARVKHLEEVVARLEAEARASADTAAGETPPTRKRQR